MAVKRFTLTSCLHIRNGFIVWTWYIKGDIKILDVIYWVYFDAYQNLILDFEKAYLKN